MNEEQAKTVAEAMGGETWQSGGDIWLVIIRRSDSKVVALSDEVVCVYDSDRALYEGAHPAQTLPLH